MKFNSLKDKCEYFRSLADYKLTPNSYVIAMLDGHSFSKLIKNKYKKPFDERFMGYMDKVAEYLCARLQGAKVAYVQSDEISILITDFDNPDTDSPFGYRLCKLQSLLAGMAAARFNQLVLQDAFNDYHCTHGLLSIEGNKYPYDDFYSMVESQKLAEFDCKVWNVPDWNTAFCHFLWRQNDCTRNSKQQAAQTYLSHKELMGKSADKQVEFLKEKFGIDWNGYTDGEKYGRIIYRTQETYVDQVSGLDYVRNYWRTHEATPFGNEDSIIRTLIPLK